MYSVQKHFFEREMALILKPESDSLNEKLFIFSGLPCVNFESMST